MGTYDFYSHSSGPRAELALVTEIEKYLTKLKPKEHEFIKSMKASLTIGTKPSSNQVKWLQDIYGRVTDFEE